MAVSVAEQLTGTFLLGNDADGVRTADADRRDTRRLHHIKRVLCAHGTAQVRWTTYTSAPDLRSDEEEGKKDRVLGGTRRLGTGVPQGRRWWCGGHSPGHAAAHIADRRKISPELGVVREQGGEGVCLFVCAARLGDLGHMTIHAYARRRCGSSSYSTRRREDSPFGPRPDYIQFDGIRVQPGF